MPVLIIENKEANDNQPPNPLPGVLSKFADVEEVNYRDDKLAAILKRLKRNHGFVVLSQVPITYKYETAETPERKASVQKVIESGVPIFSICLGFQSLGLAYGGTLRKGEEPEEGEINVRVLHPLTIFRGLGDEFPAITNHKASLNLAGSELVRTATSDDCEVQAATHPFLPYDGVQFHPEESSEDVRDVIFKNVVAKANSFYRQMAA